MLSFVDRRALWRYPIHEYMNKQQALGRVDSKQKKRSTQKQSDTDEQENHPFATRPNKRRRYSCGKRVFMRKDPKIEGPTYQTTKIANDRRSTLVIDTRHIKGRKYRSIEVRKCRNITQSNNPNDGRSKDRNIDSTIYRNSFPFVLSSCGKAGPLVWYGHKVSVHRLRNDR